MSTQFTHADVKQHWATADIDTPIARQEFGQSCFTDADSENHIETFYAVKNAFPDTLAFWCAAAKLSLLLDDADDGERWANEYLTDGAVSSLTGREFQQWLSRYTSTLMPQCKLDLPEPSDRFVRVWINNMDDALVGPVPSGFWALRWYSTA